jgi:hypothetical protein
MFVPFLHHQVSITVQQSFHHFDCAPPDFRSLEFTFNRGQQSGGTARQN